MTKHLSVWAIAFSLSVALPVWADSPAQSLPGLLERTGRQVEKFWSYFAAVTCTETLTQTKIGAKNKVLFEQRGVFDYLIMLQNSGLDLSVNESRIEKTHKSTKGKASLLDSNGFAIIALIFHPLYQSRYEFRQLAGENLDGHPFQRVHFEQITHDRPLSVLRLRDREYPIQWNGTAWIDPRSGAVGRIQAGVGATLVDRGLLQLDADVTYSDIPFNSEVRYWLPTRAVIEAETARQHWRNIHQFSDYRRFDVETEIRTASPQ